MKCGTVPLYALVKAGRMDAEFFLDPGKSIDEEVARLSVAIARKQSKIAQLQREKQELQARREQVQGIAMLKED